MKKFAVLSLLLSFAFAGIAQKDSTLRKKDRKRNVELITGYGSIILRLSDSTPLHRDNFLRLVKVGFYDSVLFHRVIQGFMIQSGDPTSKKAEPGVPLGSGGPGFTIPAELRTSLFHKKGALAAARMGDNVNPEKASSGSQFYIVQGKIFTKADLDSLETTRLKGRKIAAEQREVYKTIGGTPHLDQNYTVFGMVVKGLDVVDKIAAVNKDSRDRPLNDMKILKAQVIRRKKY